MVIHLKYLMSSDLSDLLTNILNKTTIQLDISKNKQKITRKVILVYKLKLKKYYF